MRCALTIHRLASGNPSAIGPHEIFKMATLDGARCYGVEKKVGSLEKNKLADIVILDGINVPTPLTKESAIGHLLNTFSGRNVRDVFVGGKQFIQDKHLTSISDEKVTQISRESAEGLWARLNQQ